ncbi:integrase catalytic domain-containing protein [Trichonephila clavipes]|nr:integrase catalytic domain-containing protein [Trichonephila clavipes]
MGDLPKERVTPSYPFNNCGVDFCDPFMVKFKNQRKGVLNKVYVSIFACLSTKAIHLDFVSDLTSKAFIACLKRFFVRRGKSSKMFSDNGKTFVGANIEFKTLHDLLKSPDETLVSYFNDEYIDWNFIPPRSPNFGGLWESGVKSFKTHLKRVAGSSNLTLEEFITLLTEIEAALNSRPLSPLSSGFDDFETLSPGHFLIGRPVTAIVEPQLLNVKENKLTRWKRVNWLSQQIWKVWKRNYLNNLQERSKWRFSKNNVEIGTLVLIKNGTLPGNKWLTGRILEVFYGNDNKIRVVNLKLLMEK